VDRDPVTLAYIPRLATTWSQSKDGLTYDFNLRHDATFSDGTPVTADDVVFTLALTRNEQVEAPRLRVYLDKLDKVVKTGDYSVRFIYKEPYFLAFDIAASTQVLSKKFYSQFTPQQINESTGLLLGSGPYRLPDPKNWRPEPGKPIELVRNERYWGEPPGPNRLVWRVIALPAARMTALRNGEIDMYYQPTPDQFDEMKNDRALSSRLNLYEMDTLNAGFLYIGWNEKRNGKPTWFADRMVRRAMTMLIDREAVVRDIMRGHATVCSGPFSDLSPQADPSIKPYPYDPAAASQLLSNAGFSRRNGVLVDRDGKEFAFNFMYVSTSDVGKRVATFVHDALAQAGVVVHLVPTQWSTILQKTKERNYDSVFIGWGGSVENDPEQEFCTKAIQGVGDNFVQYSNPKLDAAVEKARSTPDEKARMPLWHEVHRILHEDQPYTFMFAIRELDAVDKRIKGVEPTKMGIELLKNEWYVPAAAQKYRD
jgi:peptide/nickel transport system substrate-binding protein